MSRPVFQHAKRAYRVKSAADVMDISVSTVWRYIAAGEIETVKVQGTTWILAEQIDGFFDRHSRQEAAAFPKRFAVVAGGL